MSEKAKWTFAKMIDTDLSLAMTMPSVSDLYRASLNSRETKRELFQRALEASLENLMSWERIARSEGFDVELLVDAGRGEPRVALDGDEVKFVQAYGVLVREAEEGGAE